MVHPTAGAADALLPLKDRPPPARSSTRLSRGSVEGRGQAAAGELAHVYKLHSAVTDAGYLVQSPPLEREQDSLRLRDGSTQHVCGKQFIFLPQLLTGEKSECH